jgi:enamine deaminase RidA (YjgF/YER057c/UK114 family)
MSAEDRLRELGIELPPPPKPVASYVPVVVARGMAHVAGQIARVDGAILHPGHVGAEVSVDQAREAARLCALQALSALREALGDLGAVRRVVHVSVFVASSEGFTDQPEVANGASDLFVDVFGEAGRHARVAVGVVELPLGAPVEVSVVAEVDA